MSEKLGLKFGFVGLGQCGGNIANEFAGLGYPAIAINTSQTDLCLLNNISAERRLLINVGTEGAGKNPEIGEESLSEKVDEVYKLITDAFGQHKNDMKIYICAGLGGGSGSGMICLVSNIMNEDDYNIGGIITLPSDSESPKVKLVALNIYSKLMESGGIKDYFIIDNQKNSEQIKQNVGIKTKYKKANVIVSRQLHNINKLCTQPSLLAFDPRDFETALNNSGVSLMSQIEINSELKDTLAFKNLIRESIKKSIFTIDNEEVSAIAAVFLFELPKGSSYLITEDVMNSIQKEVGNPFDVFYGVYETKLKTEKGKFTILLTGLSTKTNRIEQIEKELTDQEANLLSKIKEKQVYTSKKSNMLDEFMAVQKGERNRNDKKIETKNGEKGQKMSTLEKLRNRKK